MKFVVILGADGKPRVEFYYAESGPTPPLIEPPAPGEVKDMPRTINKKHALQKRRPRP